eukprot:14333514-Alexandrium_andersonii.AAC.1
MPDLCEGPAGPRSHFVSRSRARAPLAQVHWRLLNSNVYGGVPQNRPRIYVVGIRANHLLRTFKWPKKVDCRPLAEFLDFENLGPFA